MTSHAIHFDITQNPPTTEEIAARKVELQASLKRTKRLALAMTLTWWVVMIGFVGAGFFAELNGLTLWISSIVFMLVGMSAGVFSPSNMVDEVRSKLTSLDDLHVAECPAVLHICRNDPDAAAYQQKVVALGRGLVNAEGTAIEMWARGSSERHNQAIAKAAREALLQPVTPLAA